MIARNELSAADYYMTEKAYIAAIRRANYVIENIHWIQRKCLRALKVLLDSYDALGYVDLYEDTTRMLKLNYARNNNALIEDDSWSWEELSRIKP